MHLECAKGNSGNPQHTGHYAHRGTELPVAEWPHDSFLRHIKPCRPIIFTFGHTIDIDVAERPKNTSMIFR